MLLNSRLYLVLDKDICRQNNVVDTLRQVNKGTIDLVQLREKSACDRDFFRDAELIKQLCQRQGIIFLINDRLDIARVCDADGLHLGQSDLPLKQARRILGKGKIIGISCHSLTQAQKAQAQGADYISIGPIFSTLIKPDLKPINLKLIKIIDQKIKIPLFVIGGINSHNVNKVISYGAKRIALCRAICCAQNIRKAAQELRDIIDCIGN